METRYQSRLMAGSVFWYAVAMRVALLSAYEKTKTLSDFARELTDRGFELLASSGTANFLEKQGITSKDVALMVGEPILDHRVVTLSREIYAGLLSRHEDAREMEKLGLQRIDLVYVDLYPLEAEIARLGANEESILEKTDIGGPTLLRAAAKGRRVVLSRPSQFPEALKYIDGRVRSESYLAGLAAQAESVVAKYAAASAEFNARLSRGGL